MLGVLGRTGSGKTTLTRLLFRLYDPGQGAMRWAGSTCATSRLDGLRARVGMVTQDVQLFQASCVTIWPSSTKLRLTPRLGCARRASAGGLGAALPAGLDAALARAARAFRPARPNCWPSAGCFSTTPGWSSWTKPRRASIRPPSAAWSRHRPAAGRRTAIIVAHRLQTVQRADDILILEAGRVVEYGARVSLAADPRSRFYSLLQTGSGPRRWHDEPHDTPPRPSHARPA